MSERQRQRDRLRDQRKRDRNRNSAEPKQSLQNPLLTQPAPAYAQPAKEEEHPNPWKDQEVAKPARTTGAGGLRLAVAAEKKPKQKMPVGETNPIRLLNPELADLMEGAGLNTKTATVTQGGKICPICHLITCKWSTV